MTRDVTRIAASSVSKVRIGTAGWAVPRAVADRFAADGSLLQRYASRFDAVEINTTFYRSHRPQTLARWAEAVPADFRFAVKMPRSITHERGLIDTGDLLERFLGEIAPLGQKLGPLLVQVPPKLALDRPTAERFFTHLRRQTDGPVAFEPRHPSWFTPDARQLLDAHDLSRVAADPARVPEAAEPAGSPHLAYWRLHGSPRMYWSAYDEAHLRGLALRLPVSAAAETWCIFDNTASGAAAANALALTDELSGPHTASVWNSSG